MDAARIMSQVLEYKKLSQCLACGESELLPVLDLGVQQPANSYWKSEEEYSSRVKFRLATVFCSKCSHVQLNLAVNPDTLFRNYLYVSGTTETLRSYMRVLAEEWVSPGDTCLDVACNDGTLMRAMEAAGAGVVLGIDPALNLKKEQEGLFIRQTYWTEELARLYYANTFDLITAQNVLGHNSNPLGFMKGIEIALKKDGLAVIEMPYAPSTFGMCQFDQIYHEHISYFSRYSFSKLCERVGLIPLSSEGTPVHGGTMRYVVGKTANDCFGLDISSERREGYYSLEFHKTFAETSLRVIDEIEQALRSFDSQGFKCVAYGASAKLSVLTQSFKLQSECPLAYAVDDNPMKRGYHTPGLDLPIYAPEVLAQEGSNLLILCGSPNFKDEIIRRMRTLRPGAKGDYILYYWNGKVLGQGYE